MPILLVQFMLLSLLLCKFQELARRCDTLIRLVEKENEEVEAAEREERKKSTKKTSGSRVTDSSGGAGGGSTKVAQLPLCLGSALFS